MKYHDIEKVSLVNGDGIRTVLWVSGCSHHCKGCQNPVTWDPDDGIEFTAASLLELFDKCGRDYIDGLTLSGGDPMFPANRGEVTRICWMFRTQFGDRKTIWMYTGYTFEEIQDEPVLQYLDVIVDGEYIDELRDVNYMWAGSTNQKVWRKAGGVWQ